MVSAQTPHVPGAFYHVTHRGNRKEEIFRSDADYRTLELLVRGAVDRFATEVHAYCWMPNHIHLLVRVREAPVHRFVQHFASRYALRFNEAHGTVGHLFQGRHWAGIVDSDAYLRSAVRYIHQNPSEARLVRDPAEFTWSSHRTYITGRGPGWLTTSWILGLFGEADAEQRGAFRRFIGDWRPPALALDRLAAEAEQRFDLSPGELRGRSRSISARTARLWIARRAAQDIGLPLIEISTYLGRDPHTLARGMAECPQLTADASLPLATSATRQGSPSRRS